MKLVGHSKLQRGAAAVEMVIVLPVLMLILVAITEFGNAYLQCTILDKMAQSGIRYATTDITGTATYDSIADVSAIKNMVVYGHS